MYRNFLNLYHRIRGSFRRSRRGVEYSEYLGYRAQARSSTFLECRDQQLYLTNRSYGITLSCNPAGAAIFKLCDGRPISDIVDTLGAELSEQNINITREVVDTLIQLEKRKIIILAQGSAKPTKKHPSRRRSRLERRMVELTSKHGIDEFLLLKFNGDSQPVLSFKRIKNREQESHNVLEILQLIDFTGVSGHLLVDLSTNPAMGRKPETKSIHELSRLVSITSPTVAGPLLHKGYLLFPDPELRNSTDPKPELIDEHTWDAKRPLAAWYDHDPDLRVSPVSGFRQFARDNRHIPKVFNAKSDFPGDEIPEPVQLVFRYKYLIHFDRDSESDVRLVSKLLSNSLVFINETIMTSGLTRYLEPFVHYIPFREDLSDLQSRILWARENEPECRHIIHNAHSLVQGFSFETECTRFKDQVQSGIRFIELSGNTTSGSD